jgi:predicted metal-dependent phosphoesterase TrpH
MLKRFSLYCFILLFAMTNSLHAAEWYRGNLHMHSFWSDGNVFPEQAVDWYKDNGYHFVVLSDHSLLQTDTQYWVKAPTGEHWTALWEKYVQRYGQPETREVEGVTQFRLHTIQELKKKLDVPGKFLMIPGHELNATANGLTLHANAINVTETIPFQEGNSLAESIDKNARAVKANGVASGQESLFMLNHPMWPYYDINPISIVMTKEVRLYEFLCANGGPAARYEESNSFWNRESLWDIITAFRTLGRLPLIYGTGTDDTHDYLNFRNRGDNPGLAWVVVRAEKLEPNTIVQALSQGDFYVSTGVEMEDIIFDNASGTLTVKVKPVDGTKYRIKFIGTKNNFDRTVEPFDVEATDKNPARRCWTFSKDIGIELAAVDGIQASYQLKADDLYVRAVIISDEKKTIRGGITPDTSSAWTQPFCR